MPSRARPKFGNKEEKGDFSLRLIKSLLMDPSSISSIIAEATDWEYSTVHTVVLTVTYTGRTVVYSDTVIRICGFLLYTVCMYV